MGRSTFGNVQSTLELQPRLRLVKPAFIVRNDRSGADEPNPRLPLLDQYLSSGKLFAKRNLPIRANDLDANFVFYGAHFGRAPSSARRVFWVCIPTARWHYSTKRVWDINSAAGGMRSGRDLGLGDFTVEGLR